MNPPKRPFGIAAISYFFCFGACMGGLSAFMLLFPGSALDSLWRVNPHAQAGFAAMGNWAVLLMAAVGAACLSAAVGLWQRKRWGLWTAIAILAVNLVGDTLSAGLQHDWHTLIGLPIGGAMIWYLLRHRRIQRTIVHNARSI
jgi:uncharacterized membrane protein (DUF2068 family)